MMRSVAWSATCLVCIVLIACGDESSPTAPSSAPTSFNGQWSGTTSQGQPVSFTVASDRVSVLFVRPQCGESFAFWTVTKR
jgi:hypothetical protein